MTYDEAREFVENTFAPEIRNVFLEIWPDIFVRSRTLDKQIYDKSNGHMYEWYFMILNKLQNLPETPCIYEFQFNDNGYDYIQKMYNDFKQSKDKLKFLLTYI